MTLADLLAFASTPTIRVLLLLPIAVIFVDWISGVARAMHDHSFRTSMLADFAHNNLMPYAMILATFASALLAGTPIEVAFAAATVAVTSFCASQVASIVANVADFTGFPATTLETLLAGLLARLFPAPGTQTSNAQVIAPAATEEAASVTSTDASTDAV